jgi:O-antigen ligase
LLCILFWLIFYVNLPNNLQGFAGNKGPVQTADALARFIKMGSIVLSVYLIGTRWALTRAMAKDINVGAIAFLILAPLSALWSIDRSATLLRDVSLSSIVLICFAACVDGSDPRRFQQLALPPLMIILIASLVVGVIMPDSIAEIGNDASQRNAWHGITHGKNEFGMDASLGVIICTNAWLARVKYRVWAFAGAVAAGVCLILSRSNTSLFATIVAVGSMVLLLRVPLIKRKYSTHVVVAIAATIVVYELVIQNVIPGTHTLLSPITNLVGKDTTFSARTIIWKVIKEHIQWAPYLGTGYGAYWVGPFPTSPSYIFLGIMDFYPTESHNGYLEVMNDLGLLGLSCLCLFLVVFIRQALELLRSDRSQAALYLALLFQEMVMNMSESDWFSRSNTFSVFALGCACLSRGLFESRKIPLPVGPPDEPAKRAHVRGRRQILARRP